jgi:uncharacterized protein (TIGR02996 family)
MDEELAILRKLATNPYDLGLLGAYADWLADHGRDADAAEVRRAVVKAPRPTNQARYYKRLESDDLAVEWGCQTLREFIALCSTEPWTDVLKTESAMEPGK